MLPSFTKVPHFTLSDLSWRGRVCKGLQLPFRDNIVAFGSGAFKQKSVPMACTLCMCLLALPREQETSCKVHQEKHNASGVAVAVLSFKDSLTSYCWECA